MSSVITCKLMGGLGNQLFQIFTTMSFAIKNKKKFRFINAEKLYIGVTVRPTYWDNLLLCLKNFNYDNNELDIHIVLKEKSFRYNELIYENINNTKNIQLFGYFQSYKYFQDYFNTICKMINLEKNKIIVMNKYNHDYKNTTSVHFRLGDYKNIQDYHNILPYEYYKNCITFILSKTNNKSLNILYFCQEEDNDAVYNIINRLENNFNNNDSYSINITFIKAYDNIEDWEQMLMMSCCENNIIANSTFSLWGAYFNNNVNKIVCYPDKWFGPKNNDCTDDLFYPEWNKINII